jgi:hypothetical protein
MEHLMEHLMEHVKGLLMHAVKVRMKQNHWE